MNFLNHLRTAIANLWLNKLRSLLTILGVVIGIAAIIIVIGIGEGSRRVIMDQMKEVGADLLWVYIDVDRDRHGRDKPYREVSFSQKDMEAILKRCSRVKAIAPRIDYLGRFRFLNKERMLSLIGTTSPYLNIQHLKLIKGRFLSDSDIANSGRVCVLEDSVPMRECFGLSNPVGREVMIEQRRFVVVGLIEERKARGESRQVKAYLPISTLGKIIPINPQTLYVQATSSSSVERASAQINQVLLNRYQDKPVRFDIDSLVESLKAARQINQTTTLTIAGVAAISLLVGGIGIMNIMLVSVTERIREIGLRRALGASRRDILFLFLIEATSLSLIGGILGLLIGVIGIIVAAPLFKVPIAIPFWAPIIAFLFSACTGIVSGINPAQRASRLNPIEALRHE
ncbi:MAG: ABC transporter permease [bacterium]